MARRLSPILITAVVTLTGCNVTKSSNPLSPTIAGPIPGVEISQPKPLEPPQGFQVSVDNQPLTLTIENSATNGMRPLSYTFEVAIDANFTNKVFVREGVPPGTGRTSVQLADRLAAERTYYWRARALDGANSGDFSGGIHFNVFTPIVIGEPELRSPAPNVTTSTTQPTFVFGNSPRSGPVGLITYQIDVSQSVDFTARVALWSDSEDGGGGGQTTTALPGTLNPSTIYYWRVRAADPTVVGPWSGVWAFVTPAVSASPSPGPVDPGAPCIGSDPLGIMLCNRGKYGTPLSKNEHYLFLAGSARDMNAAGVPGGPFGILRKEGGNQCNGYSCDIICAGQGTAQRQWDVLIDETHPTWGSPKTVADGIRIDLCEIQ